MPGHPVLGIGILALLFFCVSVCFCAEEITEVNPGKIKQLQKRLQLDPEDREALLLLGLEYTLQKQTAKAVETYFALLKIDPHNFHAYNNLGILYKKNGQYKECLFCYEQAQKINPGSYWVPYNMGLCFEAMGRMQEAREAYGKALSLNPDFAQALDRLRELSPGSGGNAPLPKPPGAQILVADSPEGGPKAVSGSPGKPDGGDSKPAAPPGEAGKKPEKGSTPSAPTPSGKTEKVPGKEEKPEKKPAEMIHTLRTGPGATLFNQALDALEKEELPKAIELYVRCVMTEREFLSEPENGLIQKALELLGDRPNVMGDGLFYRGYLTSIIGDLEKASVDLQAYLTQGEGGKTPVFAEDAKVIIEKYEKQKAAAEASKAAAASQSALAVLPPPTSDASGAFSPRQDDFFIKKMTIDEILTEANRLARESRTLDAIAVLKVGLDKEPDNVQALMAMANAYIDLMLLKGDTEAGKMARDIFQRVIRAAPPGSKEAGIAESMVKELNTRYK